MLMIALLIYVCEDKLCPASGLRNSLQVQQVAQMCMCVYLFSYVGG